MSENKNDISHRDQRHLEKVTWDEAEARLVIAPCVAMKGGLMEALHAVQHVYGYIPEESYDLLADAFNLSRAEVYGVKSFYHDFKSEPTGHHVIQICQAEACQARGSRNLTRHIEEYFAIKLGKTSRDGHVTLEEVYCLGNCAVSPNITVDGQLHGRMSEARFETLLKKMGGRS